MKFLRTLAAVAALTGVVALAGCGDDSSTTVTPDGYGRVTVAVTDAPISDLTDISNLFVTFDRVFVFPVPDSIPPDTTDDALARVEILTQPITFDLLSLTNGLSQALGSADLPAGVYRAVVLDLAEDGAWLIEADGDSHDVIVPSGRLFVKTHFEVVEGQTTEVLLDFDVAASLHLNLTGNGKYILRPVLHQLPPAPEAGSIAGTVMVETDSGLVSAGDIMVPNPLFGRGGNDQGNGRRPGDRFDRGRRPDFNRPLVPLTVAFPMVVHARVHGDTSDDDEDEALRNRLGRLDDDDDDDDPRRPHPRGTLVNRDGEWLLARLHLDTEYDLRLFVHPRAGFEIVSGPGTILVNGDVTGQQFVIRRKPADD
jgi:hypothetical protein